MGIPVMAVVFNTAWDTVSSLVYPAVPILRVSGLMWALVDGALLWQAWRIGRKDYPGMPRTTYRWMLAGALVFAFSLMVVAPPEFGDGHQLYTGLGATALMSFLFVTGLYRRGSTEGQTMYIGLARLIGILSAITVAAQVFPDRHLFTLFYVTIVTLDVTYLVMLHRQFKKEGVSPWRKW